VEVHRAVLAAVLAVEALVVVVLQAVGKEFNLKYNKPIAYSCL